MLTMLAKPKRTFTRGTGLPMPSPVRPIRTGAFVVCATLTLFSISRSAAAVSDTKPTLVSAVHGRSISVATAAGKTRIDIHTPHGLRSLSLRRDAASDPHSPILGMRLVGEVGEGVVVLTDTVQSRPSGPLDYCQSGEETTLRVIALRPKGLAETAKWKVGSCIDGFEASAPPVLDGQVLVVNWLHAPIAGRGPGVLRATIVPGGAVRGTIAPR